MSPSCPSPPDTISDAHNSKGFISARVLSPWAAGARQEGVMRGLVEENHSPQGSRKQSPGRSHREPPLPGLTQDLPCCPEPISPSKSAVAPHNPITFQTPETVGTTSDLTHRAPERPLGHSRCAPSPLLCSLGLDKCEKTHTHHESVTESSFASLTILWASPWLCSPKSEWPSIEGQNQCVHSDVAADY